MRESLRRLRHKPGTSVVLGFDLITAAVPDDVAVTEPCVAWAYADHAAAKIAKTLERIPAEACLAHDPGAHVLVATAAGDRALPLLPLLGDADATARFLDRCFLTPDPGRARIRTVRHNPGRRWVGVRARRSRTCCCAPTRPPRGWSGPPVATSHWTAPMCPPRARSGSRARSPPSRSRGPRATPSRWRGRGLAGRREHPRPPARQHPREPPDPRPGHDAAAVERAPSRSRTSSRRSPTRSGHRRDHGPAAGGPAPTWSPCTATSRPTRWWWGRTASRSSSTSTPPTPVRRPPTWAAWWRRPSPRPRRWARRRRRARRRGPAGGIPRRTPTTRPVRGGRAGHRVPASQGGRPVPDLRAGLGRAGDQPGGPHPGRPGRPGHGGPPR